MSVNSREIKTYKRKEILLGIAIYFLLAVLLAYVLLPFFWMISTSLKPSKYILSPKFTFIPPKLTLDHYIGVWTYGKMDKYFRNTVIVACLTVLLNFLAVVPAAYSVSKLKFKGRRFLTPSILLMQMFPTILLLIPLYIVMKSYGLINTYAALILSYSTFTIPFCFLLSKTYFDSLPNELFEAARIDGCSSFHAFVKIGLPLAIPGLMVTCLFAFILSWNDFMFANTFTNDATCRTLTVGLVVLQTSWEIDWGAMMAASSITTLPVIVIFTLASKYIIGGLTAGAVKG